MIYKTENKSPETEILPSTENLIAFCSGSKGIGKTWLASTVAHALSLKRKKILFFDADCGLENVSFQLDLADRVPYASFLSGFRTLNNAVFAFPKGNFDLISAPAGENAFFSAPLGRVQIMASDLSYLSRSYDAVFLDCADENLKAVNIFLKLCRIIVLLVNPDPVALSEAYRKILRIKKINPTARLQIVLNHAQSVEEGRQLYKLLLKASEEYIKLDLNLLGVVRQDAHIREAVLNKELLLKRYPGCIGTQDAVAIGEELLKEMR